MENRLVVKNKDGKDETIEVVDIILDNETGKKYMFYHLLDDEGIYASILKESETSYFLETITDENEWALVEELLKNEVPIEGEENE